MGSATRTKIATASNTGLHAAGGCQRKDKTTSARKIRVTTYDVPYVQSVSAKKRAAAISQRFPSLPRERKYTPARKKAGNRFTPRAQREIMMCHGEIARKKAAIPASVRSPLRRTT